ncbi:MAG: radical SAM protein [Bacilli bacterium]|nr:radical SAM protein [Bacilli bacterium]
MKDFVIRQGEEITFAINIKESETIYEFDGVSKIIFDNMDKDWKYISNILKDKYNNVSEKEMEDDYINFINELKLLRITSDNIENIIINIENCDIKNASVEIINSCPFKCDHCYVSNKKQQININDYRKIIDQLSSLNCVELLITGGEPFLHPNFIEMYLYAKSKGILVSINSNIFLLNDKILNVICEYKPKVIEVSLYGFDNDSYFKFTHVKNAYSIINKNITSLINNNINISLKSVLTKKSMDYIYILKKYADNYKIPFRYDYIIFPNQDGLKDNPERCSPEEIVSVLKKDEDTVNFFRSKVKNIPTNIEDNCYIFQCSIGKDRIFISSNLDIRPCLVVPFKYNLSKYTIKEAYYKFKNISKIYKNNKDNKCINCNKKSICRYCPGKFYMETGSFETIPDFYCDLANKIIKEFSL